jgi:hypothetical protein
VTLAVRVLKRLVEVLGGEIAAAHHLGVRALDVALWLRGYDVPPRAVLLQAVDLLIARDQYHDLPAIRPSDLPGIDLPSKPLNDC